MDPALVTPAAYVIMAVIGVVALKIYTDARSKDRAAITPEQVAAKDMEIARLQAALDAEARRVRAFRGHYDHPPDLEYEADGEGGLAELIEAVVGKLPEWSKPLINHPRVQDRLIDTVANNPDIIGRLLGTSTSKKTDIPTLPQGL